MGAAFALQELRRLCWGSLKTGSSNTWRYDANGLRLARGHPVFWRPSVCKRTDDIISCARSLAMCATVN
eukprot:453775-Pyramimonas_sp.AAC.1